MRHDSIEEISLTRKTYRSSFVNLFRVVRVVFITNGGKNVQLAGILLTLTGWYVVGPYSIVTSYLISSNQVVAYRTVEEEDIRMFVRPCLTSKRWCARINAVSWDK